MLKEELISLYFLGKLSSKQKEEFDRLIVEDSDFAEEVAFQQEVKRFIREEENQKVKSQLVALETEKFMQQKRKKNWLIAASVIMILSLAGYWIINSRSPNHEKLYAQYFEPYRNIVVPIVRGNDSTSLTIEAFKAYEAKDYEKAISYFDSLLVASPMGTVQFYKANSLMQLNRHDEAISILETNLQLDSNLSSKKYWFLALAYLKQEKLAKAKIQLEKLLTQKSQFKHKEATELLKRLE